MSTECSETDNGRNQIFVASIKSIYKGITAIYLVLAWESMS